MGINNFFKEFDQAKQLKNLSEYKNQRCAIDGYVWMHKALHTRALQPQTQKKVDKFVAYFQPLIDRLIRLNIQITIVWDGAKHPMKKKTNDQRFLIRKRKYEEAIRNFKQGYVRESLENFKKAISITPGLVHCVQLKLQQLYENKIQFITAPYEADAQLAYLVNQNFVDFVISVDSDLIVFGAKKVFYKMDHFFNGDEFTLERVLKEGNISQIDLIKICILRGCDYLESPYGIGFKRAIKLFQKFGSIEEIVKSSKYNFENNYLRQFYKSYLTFRFMWVFCPRDKKMKFLNSDKTEEDWRLLRFFQENLSLDFLGAFKEDFQACKIANGQIDPITETSFIKEFDLMYKINKTKTLKNQQFDISFSIILNDLEKQFLNDYDFRTSKDDFSQNDHKKKINHELLLYILSNRQINSNDIQSWPFQEIQQQIKINQTQNSFDYENLLRQLPESNQKIDSFKNDLEMQLYQQLSKERVNDPSRIQQLVNQFLQVRLTKKITKDDSYQFQDNDYRLDFLDQPNFDNNQQKSQFDDQDVEYFSFKKPSQNVTKNPENDEFFNDLQKCVQNQKNNFQQINQQTPQEFTNLNLDQNFVTLKNQFKDLRFQNQEAKTKKKLIYNSEKTQTFIHKIDKASLDQDPIITIQIQKEIVKKNPNIKIIVQLTEQLVLDKFIQKFKEKSICIQQNKIQEFGFLLNIFFQKMYQIQKIITNQKILFLIIQIRLKKIRNEQFSQYLILQNFKKSKNQKKINYNQ